ncbi:MAG: xanthine dehydrogenase family protein, partial [Nocardiopsaceae bacterium]|nr:xanthine dehydrogenase family protein [Nocardiopsaceae bacterium]
MSEAYIGASVGRVEDPRLLTGRGRYVADVTVTRMKHAAFVRAWPAHARIVSIDTSRARELPGVHAVLTAADLPPATLADGNRIEGLAKTPQPVLATGKVRFVGEAVAIVVAEDRYIAEDAAELVDVEYDPLPAVVTPGAKPDGHVPIIDELPDDIIYDQSASFTGPAGPASPAGPDADAVFASAPHVFVKELSMARSMAAPMECRGTVAAYAPASAELDVWCSTQSPHLLRRRLSAASGLAENRVRVHMHDVGGGFGQKIAAQPEELVVALAAVRLATAVKWVEDRREHLMAAPHARGQSLRLELAVGDDGEFLALRAEVTGDAGAYSFNAASALIEPFLTARILPGVYRIDRYSYRVVTGLTNKSPVAPYRGVGFVAAQAARELLIDEAARELDIDRLELRRRNMVRPEDFPYTSCTGLVYDSGSYLESLATVQRMSGYESFQRQQAEARENGRLIGLGFSPYVEPTGWGTEGMDQIGWHSFPSNDSARVSVDQSGKVTVSVGTASQGQGIETTLAQIAADAVGVRLEDVVVRFGDTSSAPISLAGTRASRVAVVSGGAVGLAGLDIRGKILNIAGLMLESDPATLSASGGMVTSSAGASIPVADVVQRAFGMTEVRAVDPEPNFTSTRFYDPPATYSNAALAALVEIDPGTGGVKVLRMFGAEDCGTTINPKIVEGQFSGAIVQGLGGALTERIAYSDDGELLTTTFMDYLLPTSGEAPGIDIEHLESPSPHTWAGIKGVGESGVVGAPAAIAAAVADAVAHLGSTVTRLPLLPEDVFTLVHPATGLRSPGLRSAAGRARSPGAPPKITIPIIQNKMVAAPP